MTEEQPLELLSPISWVDHAKSGSVKKRRKAVLKYWVTANSFPSVTEGIKTVQGNGHLYGSFDNTMGLLEKEGMSPATLHQYRNIYKDFLNSCIADLDEKAYERIVRKEENTGSVTEKYTPVVDEVKQILLHANTRGKAIVSILADTGMRINEALSRKRSDIEFDYQPFQGVVVPARIRIEAGATKKRHIRYCYLSHEAVKLLKDYWKDTRQSDWAFPSEWCKTRDTHLLDSNLRKEFHALFDRLELTPKQVDMTFSPHSFRSFCLGIMRRSGFSDVQGKIIVGHRDLETKSYKGNERDIAKNWVEIVEPRLNFLSERIEVIKKDPEQERRIRELEAKSEKSESKNTAILDALGYLLTPEQRKRLGLKLPYYSDEQIENLLEDQNALPDKSEGSS